MPSMPTTHLWVKLHARPVTWRCESDIDGVLPVTETPDSNGSVDGAVYLTEGEHYIRLNVADQTGKTGFDGVNILIVLKKKFLLI